MKTQTNGDELERQRFEEFMAKRFHDSVDRRRCRNGDQGYMAWDMIVAWSAWQAAVSIKQEQSNGENPVLPAG